MAEEPIKTQSDEQTITKEEHKANLVKKLVECLTSVMKATFSKGDADTVWYKKGLYYVAAGLLAAIVYAFTYHGIEIIDWVTTFISGLF